MSTNPASTAVAKPPPLTPARALQLIADNDPNFNECDLSGNATYAMKSAAFTKEIGLALKTNTELKKLVLSNLGITDAAVKFIADALRENKTLTYLNLSKNKFGSIGLIDLADAITHNATLIDIDLLGQSQPFGDQALSKIIAMFNYNITLKNISWRLQSRQSFAINKLIVRNNEIERRLATGKSIIDILPEVRKAEFGGTPGEIPAPSAEGNSVETAEDAKPAEQVPPSPSRVEQPPPKPKPITTRSATTVAPTPNIQPKPSGGKMLSRYLQAAQAVDAPKEPDPVKKTINLPEGAGASKLTSIFEAKKEEPEPVKKPAAPRAATRTYTAPVIQSTSPRSVPITQRSPAVPTTPRGGQNATPTTPRSTPDSDKKPLPKPAPVPHQQGQNRVASIWKDKFEAKTEDQSQPVKSGASSARVANKVSSVWTPVVGDVQKTVVEVPTSSGASKAASTWHQRTEEAEKQQLEQQQAEVRRSQSRKIEIQQPQEQHPEPESQTQPETDKHQESEHQPEQPKLEPEHHEEQHQESEHHAEQHQDLEHDAEPVHQSEDHSKLEHITEHDTEHQNGFQENTTDNTVDEIL